MPENENTGLERRFIISIIHKEEALLYARNKGFKPDMLTDVHFSNLADAFIKYYDAYHKLPDAGSFALFVQTLNKSNQEQRLRSGLLYQELLIEDPDTDEYRVIVDAVIKTYKANTTKSLILSLQNNYNALHIDEALNTLAEKTAALRDLGSAEELVSEYTARAQERIQHYEDIKNKKYETGLLYNFPTLNRVTGGQDKRTLWVIRGGPKAGKSTAMLNMANHVCENGKNIVYFTAEVSREVLERRLDSLRTDIPALAIKMGQMTEEEERRYKDTLLTHNPNRGKFVIVDGGFMTTDTILNDVKKLKAEMRIDLVVVDYLGLIKTPYKAESRWVEVGEVAKGLRALAKSENVPVLTANQSNRKGETANAQEVDRTCDLLIDLTRDNPDEDAIAGASVEVTATIVFSRDSGLATWPLDCRFDFGRMEEPITAFTR